MDFADTDQPWFSPKTLHKFHGQGRESHPMILSVGYLTTIEGRPILSDGLFGGCSQLQYQAASPAG